MGWEIDKRFVEPIENASRPATLAALSLAVLSIGEEPPLGLKLVLLLGAILFLLSAFFIFFYSIYPTKTKLWTFTAITFLLGLVCSILSSILLLLLI
ncbi:MAG: hypothetical protein JSW72_01170 [Candidatus Bathyarchaeota archaeon]|nr:MAG: hypothetical protein JSW72_01170 [Candidatus Bathyarchaeota archaeon]